jgi:hypothetical protein
MMEDEASTRSRTNLLTWQSGLEWNKVLVLPPYANDACSQRDFSDPYLSSPIRK